ncbi:DTW domain containing protein [Stutzerimonas stutzeri]|uniref:tRNA-uridine aminocarboxypropyltransferase n=1 Tax=Stutzerimonas stutzeri subgroup TaxID=578833 RepID=UPI000C6E1015|nr:MULTISPECIES: tRNA-uridine aminocarboxypropyltransferase [Stutzerimonas stutzeri subgroup]MCQ2047454.1 DTW domain-containing protein [Stutzerimonas kunmingensis]PKR28902.1 DTW domain-containing protein [Stutzerimonas stutzeri]QQC12946.1 DTW domain-containing protein [Stutzerimonas stutzeri]VEI35917.1 DTW domain containing protein [Stutzerimonas stutzeri]
MPHAVARLRSERLAKSLKPFVARGSRASRCERCRVPFSHCLCPWLPTIESDCGVCLLMHDIEPLKPSNTGWLIADVVRDTFAFTWQRMGVDPRLLALLADPQWQPLVIFPGEYAESRRVVEQVERENVKRPLFILLDATWTEARKMFRKSPYLDGLPVLSLRPEALSRYRLRRSTRSDHLCTAEVAALCLDLAGDSAAANTLDALLDVFTEHYLGAKYHRQPDLQNAAHLALKPAR